MWLPDLEQCRLSFLQKVLTEEKKSLEFDQVKLRKVDDHWNDWSVKNVWPLVCSNVEMCQYLPSEEMAEGRFPDKLFFWGVLFTVLPVWSNDYYDQVVRKRTQMKKEQ